MRAMWVAVMVMTLAGFSGAQEQTTTPDELNRKYNDALAQLKAAQDRKNELATENEKLTSRIADLEQKLKEAERKESAFNERTWFLRSHYAAWQAFLRQHPLLLQRWRLFIESSPLAAPSALPDFNETADLLSTP